MRITAPDSIYSENLYTLLTVRLRDPRGKYTYQTPDAWGHTTLVNPPDESSVSLFRPYATIYSGR